MASTFIQVVFSALLTLLFTGVSIDGRTNAYARMNSQCQFYTETCHWSNGSDWTWVKPGVTGMSLDGPPEGVRGQSALLAHLQPTLSGRSMKVQLESPSFTAEPTFTMTSSFTCFTFDYYLTDEDGSNTLQLVLVGGSEIWSVGAARSSDRWFSGEAQFEQDDAVPFKLQFVASGNSGFVALQNFKLRPEACHYDVCSFESGNCGWKSTDPLGAFKVSRAKDTAESTRGDHTSHSPSGHVMYFAPHGARSDIQLFGPAIDSLFQQCVSFWYLCTGTPTSTSLQLATSSSSGVLDVYWSSQESDPLQQWTRGQVEVTFLAKVNLVFMAGAHDNSSTIAIDDIAIDAFGCRAPITCAFRAEDGTCGWTEYSAKDELFWTLGAGRVVNSSLINLSNVSLGAGQFLYSDFTPMLRPSTMQLKSEVVASPKTGGACVYLNFLVASFVFATDSFTLDQIDAAGNRKVFWQFVTTDGSIGAFQTASIFIANPPQNASYRLALVAQSNHPSTYIAISKIAYSTEPSYCKKEFTTVRPSTLQPRTTLEPSASANCGFEGTLCNWWTNESFKVVTPDVALSQSNGDYLHVPPVDRTLQNSNGHYAYQNNPYNYLVAHGILTSVNPYPNSVICLSFWFYLYTDESSSLSVSLVSLNPQMSTLVYQSFACNDLNWRLVFFTIQPNVTYRNITFQSALTRGALALDDLKVTPGNCPTPSSEISHCSFESGHPCLLEPKYSTTGVHWRLYQAKVFDRYNIIDHTTYTENGHFMGLNVSSVKLRNHNQPEEFTLESGTLSTSKYECLQFSYYIDSTVSPDVTLYYEISFDKTWPAQIRWDVAGSTMNRWFTHRTRIQQPEAADEYQLFLGVVIPDGHGSGGVFIDDIIFTLGDCPNIGLCDFELGDICSLEAVQPTTPPHVNPDVKGDLAKKENGTAMTVEYLNENADRLWHVYSPHLKPTATKYPPIDNSLRTSDGTYLLLTGDTSNDRGILLTERYSLKQSASSGLAFICLSLAVYNKDTRGLNVLEVFQGESLNAKEGTKLWDIHRATNGWEVFNIKAIRKNPHSQDLFFWIVGTLGDYFTFIAIDDVSVTGDCTHPSNVLPTVAPPIGTTTPTSMTTLDPKSIFTCKSGKVIPVEKTCDWVNDCEKGEDEQTSICGSCDFLNHNLCRYDILKADVGPFTFQFSDSVNVGPSTGSHGNALYMIASGANFQGTTSLTSPLIHQAYAYCNLLFAYRSNYEPKKTLLDFTLFVYLQFEDLHTKVLVWESDYTQRRAFDWNDIELSVGRIVHPFRLIFQVVSDYEATTEYHAIDKIQMQFCEPGEPSKSDCFLAFKCTNSVCTPKAKVCDFQDDCGDGSDELNCEPKKMTDFEGDRGFGRWGGGSSSGWSITKASSMTRLRSGPTYDHTTGYSTGSYMMTKNKAEIISAPLMAPANKECQLTLYLFKNSKASALVITLTNLKTGEKKSIDRMEGVTHSWKSNYWFLDFWNDPVQVTLTAMFDLKDDFSTPYIAIDDIAFDANCQVLDSLPGNATTAKPDACSTVSCRANAGNATICLKPEQYCNFVADCTNGIDEKYCGDCNMEEGHNCQWTAQGSTDEQYWTVLKPASSSPGDLPKVDADSKSAGGYLSVFALDDASSTQYAALQSPRINAQTSANCKLQFNFYSKHGVNLHVKTLQGEFSISLLGEKRIATSWTTITVDIGAHRPGFAISLAVAGGAITGRHKDVAVDNLRLINCDPSKPVVSGSKPISCRFETDTCTWEASGPLGRSKWERTNDLHTQPGNDHTSLIIPKPSKSGTWLSSQAVQEGTKELDFLQTSVSLKAGQSYCFTFWYYFFAIDASSSLMLTAPYLASDATKTFWLTIRPMTRNWNEHSVEIPSQSDNFTLLFTGKVSSTRILGLDDFVLTKGSCPVLNNTFCDLEVNLCDWTKSGNDGWQRNTEVLMYPDHSTGTVYGHFLQATSSSKGASIRKTIASLNPIGNQIDLRRPYCLRLFYYWDVEEGRVDNSSSLSVIVTDRGGTLFRSKLSLLDTFIAGAVRQWTPLTVDLRASSKGVVEIDGLVMDAANSLLIDDISLSRTACGEHGNCDFETDMCGWENVGVVSGSKRLFWLRIQPNSQFLRGTFLHYDHSTSSAVGNYLVWPTQMVDGSSSVLKSPLLYRKKATASGTRSLCFSLYYFARASKNGIGAFSIRLTDLSLKKTKKNLVVEINATYNLDWLLFQHQFDNLPTVFQISIETAYNGNLLSDIGIDDIKLQFGTCNGSNQPTPTPPTTTPLPENEQELDCNFDQTSCNWAFDKTAWNVTDFKDQSEYYAPQIDHTYEMAKGKYLLFTKSTLKSNVTSFAITSEIKVPYNRDHCLTFWYFEDGEDGFTLQVLEMLPRYSVDLYQYNSVIENRRKWSLVKVDIPYSANYNVSEIMLSILYQPSSLRLGQFSIFALDDIKLRPWRCSHQYDYTYTFAIGYEDLELANIQPLIGGLGALETPSINGPRINAPTVDHTTNSEKGTYFLFMNNANLMAPTTYISTLSMVDIEKDQMGDSCVRFAYQTKGNASLKVYLIDADGQLDTHGMKPFWTTNFAKDSWTIAEFNKHILYKHKVIFYLEKPADNSSLVALDDLEVLSHQCQPPVNCDFDGHFCTYTLYQSKFRFGLFTAPRQDPGWPGPEFDHSTGRSGGGYLYLTAYRSIGTFTQLVSKVISGARKLTPTVTYCLSVWTQLTSPDLELRLHLVHFGPGWLDSNRTQEILHIGAVNQSDWKQLQTTLDQTLLLNTFEVQLIIEGRIGTNSRGAIAVDDITLTEGACQAGGLICENGTPIKKEQICNFKKDCPSGLDEVNCGDSCDFESDGACGWLNVLDAKQKWTIADASKPDNAFAPAFDASSSFTGHYLLMGKPSVGMTSNAEIALNYPNPALYMKNAFHSCLMIFDYFVNSTVNQYFIDVRFGPDTASWSTFYRISHIPTGAWRKATAHIGAHYTPFMVDIRGSLFDARQGAIALDNVAFVNCSLPPPLSANQSCNVNQYLCQKDRFCIDTSDVCNWVPDCPDGKDESACKEYPNGCNFEETLYTCGVTTYSAIGEESHSNVQWAIRTGRYFPDSFFPKIDNTKRTDSGNFIGLAPKQSGGRHQNATNQASFFSPMMSSKSGTKCQLRFFYFINDEPFKIQFTQLSVSVWFASKLAPESVSLVKYALDIDDDAQQRWNKAVIGYTSAAPFRFVFTGFLGSTAARIALDDMTYDGNCLPSTVQPRTFTTTTKPYSTVTPKFGISTTLAPVKRKKPASSGKGGIVAAVIVPVFLALGIALGYFGYRKYQTFKRTDENISISMKGIMEQNQ